MCGLCRAQCDEGVRGWRGVGVVGCDPVGVAPIYETGGLTGLGGAYLVYEMLCVLPGVESRA